VHADQIPLSSAALAIEAIEGPGLMSGLLSGGDDYELLFTIDPDDHARVLDLGKKCGVAIAEIGQIVNTEGVQVVDAGGQTINLERSGYSHF
jgi:thiamine-monophosphate kinase